MLTAPALQLGDARRAVLCPVDPLLSTRFDTFAKNVRRRTRVWTWEILSVGNGVVAGPALGAPAAALLVESLAASGIREILLLGPCAALSDQIEIGQCAAVTRAWSDEGTTRHYAPRRQSFEADSKLYSEIGTGACPSITVVSTDAPLLENEAWLRRWSRRADCADMEAAAVLCVAQLRKVRAAALMVVSDRCLSGTWESGFGRRSYRDGMKILIESAQNFLSA